MTVEECEPYEICVTKIEDGTSVAYCVSEITFRLIEQAKTGDVTPAYYVNHILTKPQLQQLDHIGLVATLVTLDDNTTSVFADRILLEAMGASSTVDPINGPNLCADPCS